MITFADQSRPATQRERRIHAKKQGQANDRIPESHDVQLMRRHDLVPQLVAAVKAYADYEQATLAAIIELRSRTRRAAKLDERAQLEDEMTGSIKQLIALAESYPDLKADGLLQ